jgi:bifunctional non-homologous end joining protein LigD
MTDREPKTRKPDGAVRNREPRKPLRAALPDLSQYGRLAEYNRKRHFGVTPEPTAKMGTREAGHPLEFVVQKHRAGHLHYDFRLEHRGVMLSWAIPKGPSPDPAVKRLAMETEPHPLDYNQFEGVIPEGEYGGGTVMIWDRGVWAPATPRGLGDEDEADRQIRKGDLKFVLLGQKLAGSWVLVRTRRERQWLLIKHRDQYASDDDPTVTRPLSAVSGRTMAEIAQAAGASPRQTQQAAAADPVIPRALTTAETGRRTAPRRRGPSSESGRRGAPDQPSRRPGRLLRPPG